MPPFTCPCRSRQVPALLPPLAGHSLTYRQKDDLRSLLLIGGLSPQRHWLTHVWEYDVIRGAWLRLNCTGAKPMGESGLVPSVS